LFDSEIIEMRGDKGHMMGLVPHLFQYISKGPDPLTLDASLCSSIYEGDCLALLGRGLVGQFGYLDEVASSLGFGGMGVGDVCLYDGDNHASWMQGI